jgi:quercetin dioxygenase-like cupin family protein
MTAHPLRDFQPIPTRPGQHARDLIGTEHGVTSFFVTELRMEEGDSVPLHTHPIEEAWVVTNGAP